MARTKCTARIDNLSPRSRRRLDAEIEENERKQKANAEAKKSKRKAVFLNFIYPHEVILISFFFCCQVLKITSFCIQKKWSLPIFWEYLSDQKVENSLNYRLFKYFCVIFAL